MSLELDHVFVLVSAGAPEAERLVEFGLLEGEPNVHPGQGTANRRFFFRHGMLELLYVRDEAEARAKEVAPLRLWERWSGRQSGASPFGICFRTARAVKPELPFPHWRYRPPFLHRQRFEVAESSSRVEEPLLFHIPFATRLDRHLAERAQPTDHPAGLGAITSVRVSVPPGHQPSPSLRGAGAAGLLSTFESPEPLLELSFDGAAANRAHDLRPQMPLILRE